MEIIRSIWQLYFNVVCCTFMGFFILGDSYIFNWPLYQFIDVPTYIKYITNPTHQK